MQSLSQSLSQFLPRCLMSLLLGLGLLSPLKAPAAETLKPDTLWLRQELRRMGLSRAFTEESLRHYEPEGFKTVLTLNLLGFLQPPGQHMNHVTPQAVKEAAKFIRENKKAFAEAQEKFAVPADVISSLLWIETRHGDDVGRFHTLSVFLHLLQADLKKNRRELISLALKKNQKERRYSSKELRTLMAERTKKKSQWAREQLVALASLRKKKHLDVTTLRGSFAGAFGLPQFIPSSYRDFATAFKETATPDLNTSADAIFSVANYLAENGWESQDKDSQVAALMKYNNSRDYADSILEISKQVPAQVLPLPPQREVSSAEKDAP